MVIDTPKISRHFNQQNTNNPDNAVVIDRGSYVVITVATPSRVYLNKDRPGSGNPNQGEKFELSGIDVNRGDEIVMNGPLFDENGSTVGGYIENGRVLKPFVNPDSESGNFKDTNGVIGQKQDGQMFVMTYNEWLDAGIKPSEIRWAFQNGPILQKEGHDFGKSDIGNPHNPNTQPLASSRTAIGYNNNGDMIMIYTKTPTNLYTLGEYMEQEGATNAMYLDGVNVGYIDDLQLHGNIVDGSNTLHIQQKPGPK